MQEDLTGSSHEVLYRKSKTAKTDCGTSWQKASLEHYFGHSAQSSDKTPSTKKKQQPNKIDQDYQKNAIFNSSVQLLIIKIFFICDKQRSHTYFPLQKEFTCRHTWVLEMRISELNPTLRTANTYQASKKDAHKNVCQGFALWYAIQSVSVYIYIFLKIEGTER